MTTNAQNQFCTFVLYVCGHYARIFFYYAQLCLSQIGGLLCSKLCRHNVLWPGVVYWLSNIVWVKHFFVLCMKVHVPNVYHCQFEEQHFTRMFCNDDCQCKATNLTWNLTKSVYICVCALLYVRMSVLCFRILACFAVLVCK